MLSGERTPFMDLTNLNGNELLEQQKQSTASSCTLINGSIADQGELIFSFKIKKDPVSFIASC
jgi:hypothetical protein